MKKKHLTSKSLFFISIIVILIDQLSKFWIVQAIGKNKAVTLIPHVINIRLVRNTGAAFSLLENSTNFLGILSFLVSTGLILWIWRSKKMPIMKGLGFSFLLGGCIGNGLDRWLLGYVNDFIELIPISFPIFNAADIAINLALICLIIDNISKQSSQQIHT
tara:strand:- start:251 stop:733 length:483 start_codon:yes stop_codon:yes gene_type:complete